MTYNRGVGMQNFTVPFTCEGTHSSVVTNLVTSNGANPMWSVAPSEMLSSKVALASMLPLLVTTKFGIHDSKLYYSASGIDSPWIPISFCSHTRRGNLACVCPAGVEVSLFRRAGLWGTPPKWESCWTKRAQKESLVTDCASCEQNKFGITNGDARTRGTANTASGGSSMLPSGDTSPCCEGIATDRQSPKVRRAGRYLVRVLHANSQVASTPAPSAIPSLTISIRSNQN